MRNQLYINGSWSPPAGGGTIEVFNPYTEEVLHRVAAGGPEDVDRAVAAARAALPGWRALSGAERGKYLQAIADGVAARKEELARLSSINNGKPLAESAVDMQDVISSFSYYARLAAELDHKQNSNVAVPDPSYRAKLTLEPVGVAGLIVPWNFPLVTTSWKVGPALAAGCTVVLKPSEVTPIVELELGAIAHEAGLPPGVLNIVTGTGPGVGAPMTTHRDVAKISFTGSNAVGARVMAAAASGPEGDRAGAGRQVADSGVRRCRPGSGGGIGGRRHLLQCRPDVLRHLAPAGGEIGRASPARARRPGGARADDGRSARRRDPHGSAHHPRAVRQGDLLYRTRREGRPASADRRRPAQWRRPRLVRRADHLHRRADRERALARGDLRPRPLHAHLFERGEAIASPTTAISAWSQPSPPATRRAPRGSPTRWRPDMSGSTRRRPSSSRPPGVNSRQRHRPRARPWASMLIWK